MSIEAYPVLPLKDLVIFPKMVVPLFVGRQKSIFALEEALKHNGKIILLTQKNDKENEPKSKDLYKVGVLANVLQLLKLPDGTVKILVEGSERVRINGDVEGRKYLMAFTKEFKSISNSDHDFPGEDAHIFCGLRTDPNGSASRPPSSSPSSRPWDRKIDELIFI